MNIKVITSSIPLVEVQEIAKEFYGSMIKGVVDIEKNILALGGEYHMDANLLLIEHGSRQKDVWGFNIHFTKPKDAWIEYTSLINIRPHANNNGMEVMDKSIRDVMKDIISSKII